MQIVIAITRTINFDDWLTNSDLIAIKYSENRFGEMAKMYKRIGAFIWKL